MQTMKEYRKRSPEETFRAMEAVNAVHGIYSDDYKETPDKETAMKAAATLLITYQIGTTKDPENDPREEKYIPPRGYDLTDTTVELLLQAIKEAGYAI